MNDTIKIEAVESTDLIGFLTANGRQCRFASMLTKTPVVKLKVGNPFHPIVKGQIVGNCKLFKVSRKVGLINANFNTSVRRRIAEKLGVDLEAVDYENGEVWFEHLKDNEGNTLPIVQNKVLERRGDYYVQFFTHKATSFYVDHKGATVDDAKVKQWAYKESEKPDWKPTTIAVNLSHVYSFKTSGVIVEMPELEAVESLFAD